MMSKTLVTLSTSPSFTTVSLNTSPSATKVSLPSVITWLLPGTWNGLDNKNWESATSNWETTGILGGDST